MNLILELFQNFDGIDILTLSETHIQKDSENDNDAQYNIPGYSFESRPRNFGKGGGVGVFISSKVPWDRRQDLEDKELEILCIEVWPSRKHSKGILIAIMYRPPDSSKYLRKDSYSAPSSRATKHNSPLLIKTNASLIYHTYFEECLLGCELIIGRKLDETGSPFPFLALLSSPDCLVRRQVGRGSRPATA